MTLALLAQLWLLVVVLGISGLALFYALFVELDPKATPQRLIQFQRFGIVLLWIYVVVTAFIVLGFGLGFGLEVFRKVLQA